MERCAREGGRLLRWECRFDPEVGGWEGLRAVEYVGTDADGGKRTMVVDVDHSRPVRPVRAVQSKPPPTRPVRPVRAAPARPIVECRLRHGLEVPNDPQYAQALTTLRERVTYRNPLHARLQRMGKYTGNVPREIANFEKLPGVLVFPRGILPDLMTIFERHGFAVRVHDDRIIPRARVRFAITKNAKRIVLRPEQADIVHTCVLAESGIVRAPTGSGKTEMAIALMQAIGLRTLVVVWSAGLQKQWVRRICDRLGWSEKQVGVIGGKGKPRILPVTVAMQQSLLKRPEVLEDFDALIADEVQRFAARTFREVIGRSPAKYRIGFSADETRKDRLEGLIYDHFGKVIAEIDKQSLIDRGDICDVDIELVPTTFRVEEVDLAPPAERGEVVGTLYTEIITRLVASADRNREIVRHAIRVVKQGHSTLVFTDRVEHAVELARMITSAGVPCGVARGGAKFTEERERTIARLSSGELRIATATSCLYQGTDIPRLTVGIVATPTGNNRQLLEQQVGRVRRTFKGKTKGRLIYLWDEHVFPRHLDNLRRWYGQQRVRIAEEI